jgi:hypothetical protein
MKRVLELAKEKMQQKSYSLKQQQLYLKWIKEYILYHGNRNPSYMGISEIELFKNYLSCARVVSFQLKAQATQAIFFLYTQVLGINLQKEYIKSAQNIKSHKRAQKRKMVQSIMVF